MMVVQSQNPFRHKDAKSERFPLQHSVPEEQENGGELCLYLFF